MSANHLRAFALIIIGYWSTLCAQDRESAPGSEGKITNGKYQVNPVTYLDISMFHFRIFGGSKNTSNESMRNTVVPGAVNQAIAFSFFVYLDSVSKSPTLKFDDATRKRLATSCRELTEGLTSAQMISVIKKYFPPDKDGVIGSPYLSGYSVELLDNDVEKYLEAIHAKVPPGDK